MESLNWVVVATFSLKQTELKDLNGVERIKELHLANKLEFHYVASTNGKNFRIEVFLMFDAFFLFILASF